MYKVGGISGHQHTLLEDALLSASLHSPHYPLLLGQGRAIHLWQTASSSMDERNEYLSTWFYDSVESQQ